MTRKQAMEILEAVHVDLAKETTVGPPSHYQRSLVAILLVIASTLIEMQDMP